MMKKLIISAALAAAIFMPLDAAQASKTVTSPTVTDGETTIEVKGEYDVDDRPAIRGAWNNKIDIAHGFTSFWSSEIETTIQQTGLSNARVDFSNIDWKNKFQFTKEKDFGLDTGMRITYSKNTSGDQDSVEVKLLAAKTIGPTNHKLDLIATRVVGNAPAHAVSWGFSWSSRYKISDAFQPGFEDYSTFGKIGNEQGFDTQDHRLGPVFYGKINDRLSYDAGYLIGLSHAAPDGTVKAIVKYKF